MSRDRDNHAAPSNTVLQTGPDPKERRNLGTNVFKICIRLPLYDELMKRLLVFVQKCLTCDSELVTFVSRYAVWYGRMLSPIGWNVLHCFLRYGFVVRSMSELNCQVIRNFYWQSLSRDDVDKARILLELLFARLGNFRLSNFDVHSLIVALCTE